MKRSNLNRLVVMLALAGAIAPVALAQNVDPAKAQQDAKARADEAIKRAEQAKKDADKALEKAKAGQPTMPEMSPEELAMMQAWEAARSPGEHHKHMEMMAGEWEGTNSWWSSPDSEPNVSPVRTSSKMELDGLFLVSHHKGEMMGMPFRGLGTMGYNNTTKQYEGAWMDNMGSMTMFMTGTCSDDGKVFKMESKFVDFITGEATSMKMTTTIIDADNYTWEMYGPGEDGNEFRMMEIVYKRKK